MSRTPVACIVAVLGAVILPASGRSAPRAAAGSVQGQPPQVPAPDATVLSGSEISVVESGGITGRVESARLVAGSGRIDVEYRARVAPPSTPPFTGTLESARYVALWRELEAGRVWEANSPKPTIGSDLVQVELRIRLGASGRVVRWNVEGVLTPEIRRLAEIASQVLTAGRASAFER
jgi:hypothetical protein